MEPVERLVQRYDLRRGVGINRIDHLNIAIPDVPKAFDHYQALGFGLSETIEDLSDGTLYAAWMFRKQTVHDVAFTLGAGPMLHHVAFAVPESHNVLTLCDRIGALGLMHHIERGPGRHGVSNAFYLYLRDDDGHRIEVYTTDYFTGDPDHPPLRWDVHDERRRDFWANPIVPSWYHGAARVLDLDGHPVPVVDEPPTGSATCGSAPTGSASWSARPSSEGRAWRRMPTTGSGCPVRHDFDPLSEGYLADPYAVAAAVRTETPVFYAEPLDMWVVTRMEDVEAVFTDAETFSGRLVQDPIFPLCPAARSVLGEGFDPLPVMSNNVPPDHGRVRVHTTKGFSNRRMARAGALGAAPGRGVRHARCWPGRRRPSSSTSWPSRCRPSRCSS